VVTKVTEWQDISKASTGVRTITARLRNTTTELNELGEEMSESKYNELISALTDAKVKLVDVNGEYRSTYDIISDIAAKWDELTSMQQSALASTIAGTRMQNIFFSMVNQFKEASGAMEAMAQSEGTLSESYAKYLDTTQAHYEQLSAAFQAFSSTALDSGLMKTLIDIGTLIVNALTNISKLISDLGGLKTVILSVASVLMILQSAWVAHNVSMITTKIITAVCNGFHNLVNGIQSVINIIPAAVTAWRAYAAGTLSAGAAMEATIPVIGLVLAALTLLIGGMSLASNKADESTQKTDEAAQKAANLSDEISSLASEFITLSEAVDNDKSAKEKLVGVQDKLIEKLGLEQSRIKELTDEYGSYTDAIKQAAIEKLKSERTDIEAGVGSKEESVHKAAKDISEDGRIQFSGTVEANGAGSQEIQRKLFKASKALEGAGYKSFGMSSYETAKQKGRDTTPGTIFSIEVDTKSLESIKEARDELQKALDIIKENMKGENDEYGTKNDLYQNTHAYYQQLNDAIAEYDEQVNTLNDSLAQEFTLQGLIGREIPKTNEEFSQYRDTVIQAAKASGEFGASSEEEIGEAIDSVLRKDSAFAKFYINTIDDISSQSSKKINSLKELLNSSNEDGKSFSDSIKDYKSNIDKLNDALETYQKGEMDNSTYLSLIETFPQLVGHTADLDTAIIDLMDDMDSDMVSDFDDQFGKLETQDDIDALKEYESQVLSTRKTAAQFQSDIENLVSVFGTVKSAVEEYNENGFLTLSSLQSVLSLNDKYISVLTNEQGALDLSTESYKKLVEAELIELKAQTLQNSLDTVRNIDNRSEALAYLNEREHSAAQSSLDLADAQWQEALSAAAVKDIQEGTGDLYQRTVLAAREAYDTRIALIDEYARTAFTIGELSAATDEYSKALDNEKEALENSKKALEDQKSALEDTKQGYEDALSAVKDLVSWVQDYIKQIKNDEIDALQEKKDAIDELIEAQKDLLDAEKDEYEWNKKISEKQNTVAKDALAASVASLDDSSAGRKAQKQANDKLAESRSDMLDTLYDHEIEIRKDALDKLKEEQDEYYDNLIDNIQDYLNNEVQLYKDACAMIDNDSGDLYGKLLWYCQNYTTTTEAEFNHMWNSAQSALQQYNTANLGTFELLNDLQGRIYEVDNAIDTISQSISSYESAIDGVQGKLDNLSQSAQKAISDIQAAANAEDEWTKPKWVYTWQDNDYKSWKVNRDAAISDIIKQIESRYGGVFPASAATIYGTIRKYASGTNSAAGGLSLVGEKGAEFRVLNPGDGIVKNKIVQGVTALGTNPAQFIADAGKKLLSSLFGNSIKPSFSAIGSGNNQPINIVNNIQGDVNPSTLKALVAAQKKIVQDAVKEMQIKSLSLRATNRI